MPIPAPNQLQTWTPPPGFPGSNQPKPDDPLTRIRERTLPTLSLGDGAGTKRIDEAGRFLVEDPTKVTVSDARYMQAGDAGRYLLDLQKSLGISGPQSNLESARAAVMDTLDRGAYQTSLADAQKLAAQGQQTGARSQALASLRGMELAGQRTQAEAGLQAEEGRRLDQYNQALLNAAQQQAQAQSQFRMQKAQMETEASRTDAQLKAQRELQRAETALRSGESLNAEEYRRRMAEYQNALDQVQQANTADVLAIQDRESKRGLAGTIVGGVLGAASKVAAAKMGG